MGRRGTALWSAGRDLLCLLQDDHWKNNLVYPLRHGMSANCVLADAVCQPMTFKSLHREYVHDTVYCT